MIVKNLFTDLDKVKIIETYIKMFPCSDLGILEFKYKNKLNTMSDDFCKKLMIKSIFVNLGKVIDECICLAPNLKTDNFCFCMELKDVDENNQIVNFIDTFLLTEKDIDKIKNICLQENNLFPNGYSYELTDRKDVLGFKILEKNFDFCNEYKFAASVLHEITFFGLMYYDSLSGQENVAKTLIQSAQKIENCKTVFFDDCIDGIYEKYCDETPEQKEIRIQTRKHNFDEFKKVMDIVNVENRNIKFNFFKKVLL